jgi:redox-sensitive bicupin YhaK (pirin superfamily)
MKQISFSTSGNRADIGAITIFRILPNRYAQAVGPFVFLDHIALAKHEQPLVGGTGAHPHRGIATLTYLLEGKGEHWDSRGNHAIVRSGGVQWMKAGNGIIHDETLNIDPEKGNGLTHGFQFWINLPSTIKKEEPAYKSIQGEDVPQLQLPNNAGWIKIIAGEFEGIRSAIPSYGEQFLYHLHLQPKQRFTVNFEEEIEVAAFLPLTVLEINETQFQQGDFIEFDREEGKILFSNSTDFPADVIIFGGKPYDEPIFAEGPFVMNSPKDIAMAYREFFGGKYGSIIK